MTERMVFCVKLKKNAQGLEKAPFPGDLGKRIYENVSAEAWQMWKDVQLRMINEYRMNMADPKDHGTLMDQMLQFLELKEGRKADG